MANPRNIVIRSGNAADYQTYETDFAEVTPTIVFSDTEQRGTAQRDLAVTIISGGRIKLTEDAERVIGRLDGVEKDNKARVQTRGYTTLPGGDSATLTVGKSIVGDLGTSNAKGYIREVATGTAAELGVAQGRIENSTTPATTLVFLG